MATHNYARTLPVTAAEDLVSQAVRFKVITWAGTIAPGPSRAAGVLITSTRSGETAGVQVEGVVKVVAGGAVNTLGYPLTVANSGFMVAASSGAIAYGRAIETCGSGDLVQAIVQFASPGQWPGT
ncbi:MAG: hypothetical protein N3D71_01180 [Burkholderiaceae bacterium]|nr:hypothetical protein [Burkholderiaceae bacterium]